MRRLVPALTCLTLLQLTAIAGQPVFTGAEIFPAEEFAARRALITETGYENLSALVPIEIDAIERTMREATSRR